LRAAQHRFEFKFGQLGADPIQFGFEFPFKRRVLVGELKQRLNVAQRLLKILVRLENAAYRLELRDRRLSLFRMAPEVGRGLFLKEDFPQDFFAADVKESLVRRPIDR